MLLIMGDMRNTAIHVVVPESWVPIIRDDANECGMSVSAWVRECIIPNLPVKPPEPYVENKQQRRRARRAATQRRYRAKLKREAERRRLAAFQLRWTGREVWEQLDTGPVLLATLGDDGIQLHSQRHAVEFIRGRAQEDDVPQIWKDWATSGGSASSP